MEDHEVHQVLLDHHEGQMEHREEGLSFLLELVSGSLDWDILEVLILVHEACLE
jgi:hypothetical protein